MDAWARLEDFVEFKISFFYRKVLVCIQVGDSGTPVHILV